ncbi:MAG: primary-amine oxidase, partial [Mycobacterium sp.]|nr:primary-amine oxidase [Mycobacterium sp.]
MWLRGWVTHPLDPLSADEIRTVAGILRREHGVDAGWRFASIEMLEPSKVELAAYEDDGSVPARRATVVCFERAANATYKSVVSVSADGTESFDHVPGVQPNFTVDEFVECDRMLRQHPDFLAALANRGITDIDNVFVDTWTYGDAVAPPEYRDRRLGWSDTWLKDGPGMNPYAHLISGLHCVIDLNTMELLQVEDAGRIETPEVMGEYVPRHIPEQIRAASRREPLKALHVTQPDGPSFSLDGNLLTWQNWSLRIGFNYREGMTLHTVRYQDGDRSRSVAHRMSFAEMVVPYRDSSADHYRRTAFDIGEWGLGFMTTSLE